MNVKDIDNLNDVKRPSVPFHYAGVYQHLAVLEQWKVKFSKCDWTQRSITDDLDENLYQNFHCKHDRSTKNGASRSSRLFVNHFMGLNGRTDVRTYGRTCSRHKQRSLRTHNKKNEFLQRLCVFQRHVKQMNPLTDLPTPTRTYIADCFLRCIYMCSQF